MIRIDRSERARPAPLDPRTHAVIEAARRAFASLLALADHGPVEKTAIPNAIRVFLDGLDDDALLGAAVASLRELGTEPDRVAVPQRRRRAVGVSSNGT